MGGGREKGKLRCVFYFFLMEIRDSFLFRQYDINVHVTSPILRKTEPFSSDTEHHVAASTYFPQVIFRIKSNKMKIVSNPTIV